MVGLAFAVSACTTTPEPDYTVEQGESSEADATTSDGPGAIYLLTGSETALVELGADQPLDFDTQICLDPSESVLLASDRVTFELRGENCFSAGEAEESAFRKSEEVVAAMNEEATHRAQTQEYRVISSSTMRFQQGRTLPAGSRVCLREGDVVRLQSSSRSRELTGPGCFTLERANPASLGSLLRTRPRERPVLAVIGGTTSGPRNDPVTYRVSAASQSVLERYPRGTPVDLATRICLEEDEQVTIVSSKGQRVTYRGPGCARRNTRPSADNLSGFTFGWNRFGSSSPVALP